MAHVAPVDENAASARLLKPAIMRKVLVLPHPEGPSKRQQLARLDLRSTLRVTCRTSRPHYGPAHGRDTCKRMPAGLVVRPASTLDQKPQATARPPPQRPVPSAGDGDTTKYHEHREVAAAGPTTIPSVFHYAPRDHVQLLETRTRWR